MKRLFLLRHAKASPGAPGVGDFERPLDARGREAAVRVGRELAGLGVGFDHVLASPARRVVQTLELLSEGLGRPLAPSLEPRIYLAGAAERVALVASCPAEHGSLLVAGHNPALHSVALQLSGDARLGSGFPPGTLAEILLDAPEWSGVAQGGRLDRLIRPGELD